MSPSEFAQGCPSCGSPQGSPTQYCDSCVQKKHLENQSRQERFSDSFDSPKDFTAFLFESKLTKYLGLSLLAFLIFAGYALFSPVVEEGDIAVLLLAAIAASAFISLATWVLMWITMLGLSTFGAALSLVLPPYVWRVVSLGNRPAMMPLLAFHLVAIFATVVGLIFLRQEMDVGTWKIFETILSGKFVPPPLVGRYPG